METSKLLRHLKNYQKENPLADVLSLGIYDIDFFNDDLDNDEKIDVSMWNLIVDKAKEKLDWEQISEAVSQALNNSRDELEVELEQEKRLWEGEQNVS